MSLFSESLQRFRWGDVEFPAVETSQKGGRAVSEHEQWRRDGAELWGVFRDATDATRFVETFTVASWIEHVRQHGRMTVSDRGELPGGRGDGEQEDVDADGA